MSTAICLTKVKPINLIVNEAHYNRAHINPVIGEQEEVDDGKKRKL